MLVLLLIIHAVYAGVRVVMPVCKTGDVCYSDFNPNNISFYPGCLRVFKSPLPYCIINGPPQPDYQTGYYGPCDNKYPYTGQMCVNCQTNYICTSLVSTVVDSVGPSDLRKIGGFISENHVDDDGQTSYSEDMILDTTSLLFGSTHDHLGRTCYGSDVGCYYCTCPHNNQTPANILQYACYTPLQLYNAISVVVTETITINAEFCAINDIQTGDRVFAGMTGTSSYMGLCDEGTMCYSIENIITNINTCPCIVNIQS